MNTCAPEEVGFSSERLKRIDTAMRRYVDQEKLVGIVTLVARGGQVVHFANYGKRDVKANEPMELDTIFRIYSMTKPITSVALLTLYERGLLQLHDPVSKFIPEFEKAKVWVDEGELVDAIREITIYDLLTHTAGLRYGDFEEDQIPVDKLYAQADLFSPKITNEEMVRRLCQVPLANQPGTVWHYSAATDVVGYLVEVISGMPLADFFEQRIFRPLGMVDTAFTVPPEKVDRFATLYGWSEEDPLLIIDDALGGDYFNTRLHYGGGGLVSTAADYALFAQMVLNRGQLDGMRLLGRKTVELMTTNHLPSDLLPIATTEPMPGRGFGLGFSVVMDVAQLGILGSVGEHGWGGWASTQFWVDPREELIGIVLTQYIPYGTYPLTEDFKTAVYQALID